MTYARRTVLTAIGAIAVGYATAGASGAFDVVRVERDINVSVGDDTEGYLAIEPHPDRTGIDGPKARLNGEGLIEIDLGHASLNDEGWTRFDDLLRITNNGSKDVTLEATFLDATGSTVDDAVELATDLGGSETVPVTSDESKDVGLWFDTTKDGIDDVVTIRFEATAD
ncbi:MAG: hypothetical protein ACOC0X_07060 [Halobacteriota archaeon]